MCDSLWYVIIYKNEWKYYMLIIYLYMFIYVVPSTTYTIMTGYGLNAQQK